MLGNRPSDEVGKSYTHPVGPGITTYMALIGLMKDAFDSQKRECHLRVVRNIWPLGIDHYTGGVRCAGHENKVRLQLDEVRTGRIEAPGASSTSAHKKQLMAISEEDLPPNGTQASP
jgi:hypothetical protein